MIDMLQLESLVEVEEFCLDRKIDSKEKANIILRSIDAKFKTIIDTKEFNPYKAIMKVSCLEYHALKPMSSDRYNIVAVDEHTIVLFIYSCNGEQIFLSDNTLKWGMHITLPQA